MRGIKVTSAHLSKTKPFNSQVTSLKGLKWRSLFFKAKTKPFLDK